MKQTQQQNKSQYITQTFRYIKDQLYYQSDIEKFEKWKNDRSLNSTFEEFEQNESSYYRLHQIFDKVIGTSYLDNNNTYTDERLPRWAVSGERTEYGQVYFLDHYSEEEWKKRNKKTTEYFNLLSDDEHIELTYAEKLAIIYNKTHDIVWLKSYYENHPSVSIGEDEEVFKAYNKNIKHDWHPQAIQYDMLDGSAIIRNGEELLVKENDKSDTFIKIDLLTPLSMNKQHTLDDDQYYYYYHSEPTLIDVTADRNDGKKKFFVEWSDKQTEVSGFGRYGFRILRSHFKLDILNVAEEIISKNDMINTIPDFESWQHRLENKEFKHWCERYYHPNHTKPEPFNREDFISDLADNEKLFYDRNFFLWFKKEFPDYTKIKFQTGAISNWEIQEAELFNDRFEEKVLGKY